MRAIAYICRIGAYAVIMSLAEVARQEIGWHAYVLAAAGIFCIVTQAMTLDSEELR